jgi:hypothetical protein
MLWLAKDMIPLVSDEEIAEPLLSAPNESSRPALNSSGRGLKGNNSGKCGNGGNGDAASVGEGDRGHTMGTTASPSNLLEAIGKELGGAIVREV